MSEIKNDQPRRRHGFQPGQSGNPGGRPRVIGDVVALARENTVMAMETLVSVAKDPRAPAAARVTAAAHILDRGYGRAPQTLTVVKAIADMTDAELVARIAAAEEALGVGAAEGVVH